MLEHAAGSGISLPSEIVSPLVCAKDMQEKGRWKASLEEAFWVAQSKLTAILKPVTSESLSGQSTESARFTKKWLLVVTIFLLVVLVPFSIITLTANHFSKEVEGSISEICRTEPALGMRRACEYKEWRVIKVKRGGRSNNPNMVETEALEHFNV